MAGLRPSHRLCALSRRLCVPTRRPCVACRRPCGFFTTLSEYFRGPRRPAPRLSSRSCTCHRSRRAAHRSILIPILTSGSPSAGVNGPPSTSCSPQCSGVPMCSLHSYRFGSASSSRWHRCLLFRLTLRHLWCHPRVPRHRRWGGCVVPVLDRRAGGDGGPSVTHVLDPVVCRSDPDRAGHHRGSPGGRSHPMRIARRNAGPAPTR